MELIAPSIAAIVWAFVWLQRERDRKVNQAHAAAIEAHTLAIEEQTFKLRNLDERLAAQENHISQLTDKAFR